jgi:hypothetical protein
VTVNAPATMRSRPNAVGGKNVIEDGVLPMSVDDLHDLAAKLHDYRERQLSLGSKLIADALLQAIRERVAALEGKPVAE